MAIEMHKTEVLINKPVYLGQAILDISKTLMYEFYHDYLKLKYKGKLKLCYTDTGSFIVHIETEDFYQDIARDVDKWFDTSGYDKNDERLLPIGKNKKVIGKFKDEMGGKVLKKMQTLEQRHMQCYGKKMTKNMKRKRQKAQRNA